MFACISSALDLGVLMESSNFVTGQTQGEFQRIFVEVAEMIADVGDSCRWRYHLHLDQQYVISNMHEEKKVKLGLFTQGVLICLKAVCARIVLGIIHSMCYGSKANSKVDYHSKPSHNAAMPLYHHKQDLLQTSIAKTSRKGGYMRLVKRVS